MGFYSSERERQKHLVAYPIHIVNGIILLENRWQKQSDRDSNDSYFLGVSKIGK